MVKRKSMKLPNKTQRQGPIESQTQVPPRAEWRENPELAFGVRIRVNLAIPAVWPM